MSERESKREKVNRIGSLYNMNDLEIVGSRPLKPDTFEAFRLIEAFGCGFS